MKTYIHPSKQDWEELLIRPTASYNDLEEVVSEVFEAVENKGDDAVRAYTERFDRVSIEDLQITQKALNEAAARVSGELKEAIQLAKGNIERFHRMNHSIAYLLQP